MDVETSTALATFAYLRVHFAKINLVTYYDDCVQRASEVGTPEYAAVATYQAFGTFVSVCGHGMY